MKLCQEERNEKQIVSSCARTQQWRDVSSGEGAEAQTAFLIAALRGFSSKGKIKPGYSDMAAVLLVQSRLAHCITLEKWVIFLPKPTIENGMFWSEIFIKREIVHYMNEALREFSLLSAFHSCFLAMGAFTRLFQGSSCLRWLLSAAGEISSRGSCCVTGVRFKN